MTRELIRMTGSLRGQANYLPAYKKGTIFTIVEKPLQISSFMQNKPNFRKAKMNVSAVITKDYRKTTLSQSQKTNPIQTQSKPIQSQLKPIKCQNKPNTNPISNPAPRRDHSGIFTFYFIRYTQYDICDTQKHPSNRVNRSCFAEKA
jgi:hypothetical protein